MNPRHVAVIGASPDRRKFGNKSVRAHAAAGFIVYPVHPTADRIEGLAAYRSIAEVPAERLDRVTPYVPPAVVLRLLPEIAAKNPAEVWLNPGTDTVEVVEEARRLGLNVITGCSIVNLGRSPASFPDE